MVHDQVGRLTFTADLAAAAHHLLAVDAASGVYQVSNGGDPTSWAEVAEEVFARRGRERSDVRRVTTQEYAAGKPMAPRPAHSVLDLSKIEATGLSLPPALERLETYLADRGT